jgi:AraC-like DNA-binding protein
LPTPAVRWADIAADCGYFDQSHFIKEFRRFAGAPPAEFMRRMTDLS